MNKLRMPLVPIIFCCLHANAQIDPLESAKVTTGGQRENTAYEEKARGPHHKLWERIEYERAPDGTLRAVPHRFEEMATGLHFKNDKGEWEESEAKIEILPNNAGAVAAKGQHKAIFPVDIKSGIVELQTPEGQWLRSRVWGLAYFDTATGESVLLAETKSSDGKLIGDNVVVYPDAFTDLLADIRLTYTRAGFEQDVVLRTQPPAPEKFGLDPKTTRLQVLTEFVDAPQPAKEGRPVDQLTDETLAFGEMTIGAGKAFSVDEAGEAADHVPVSKTWTPIEGRDFLIEEVRYEKVSEQLQQLPEAKVYEGASLERRGQGKTVLAGLKNLLPKRYAKTAPAKEAKPQRMARVRPDSSPSFVMDYLIVTSQTNFTFKGDSTYTVSGTVNLSGTTTIEGGAVIKYFSTNAVTLNILGSLDCRTGPYRPAVFTSADDQTVGEAVPGQTPCMDNGGVCLSAVAATALTLANGGAVHDVRFRYFTKAISSSAAYSVTNAQFLRCSNALLTTSAPFYAGNLLLSEVPMAFAGNSYTGTVEHLTYDQGTQITGGTGASTLSLVNSLLTGVTNNGVITPSFNYSSKLATNTGVYRAVAGGAYYLAASSTNRDAGTPSISAGLLAQLGKKTTYAPVAFTNLTFTTATNFYVQAQRDTNTLDLGYHYDPLDYTFGGCHANSNLTFAAGTAVGWFRADSGDQVGQGIHIGDKQIGAFAGTAAAPCYWVRLTTVQENDRTAGNGNGGLTGWAANITDAPEVQCRFTRFSMLAGDGNHMRDDYGWLNVRFRDCEFSSGGVGGYVISMYFTNCLFNRTYVAQVDGNGPCAVVLRNCTMIGNYLQLLPVSSYSPSFLVWDSAFDGTILQFANKATNSSYATYAFNVTNSQANAYPLNCASNIIAVSSFNWQTSLLGNFYLPTNSTLVNTGSLASAASIGLYHFTTQTNQAKEATSRLDLGYHYVAVDANGVPVDTDADGTADYIEDADGNGVVNAGENFWGLAINTQPQSQTVSAGSSVTLSVTAAGIAPLRYQWRFNSTNNITGATNSTYTINSVSPTNAGTFSVVVTNTQGALTSSPAVLTVTCVSPPSGMLGWWQAESNTLDSISNKHGMFVTGGYTNGYIGKGFQFDGTNSHVVIQDDGAFALTNFTIETWVKFDGMTADGSGAAAGVQYLVFKQNSRSVAAGNFEGFWLGKSQAPGYDSFVFGVSSAAGTFVPVRSLTIQTGIWYHVVAERGPDYIRLFTNGQFAAQASVSSAQDYGSQPLYLGSSGQPAYDRKFKGKLDELSIYNRPLTTNEVVALYLSGTLGKCPVPPRIVPNDRKALRGDSVSFSVAGGGTPPLGYQWRYAGTNVTGAVNGTLALTNVQISQSGSYTVFVTNSSGTVSTNANLLVQSCFPALDVMMVLDRSGSMTNLMDGSLSRFHGARIASSNFVASLNTNFDQCGLVHFADFPATNSLMLTNRSLSWNQAIQNIPNPTTGNTYMSDALLKARAEFNSSRRNPDALPVIVFLSDGQPTDLNGSYNSAVSNLVFSVADNIKKEGIVLFTVALSSQADTNFMRLLATSTNFYYYATNLAQLTNVYSLVASNICRGSDPTNQPPVVSWVSPTNGQLFVSSPTNILLSATNKGGVMTEMLFYWGTNLLGSDTTVPYQFLWQNVSNGTYTLSVIGTNSGVGASVPAYVTNIIVNAMPVVAITSPTNIQEFREVTNVTFTATASDSDGTIANVDFYNGTNLLGTDSLSPYTFVWNSRTNGYYGFTAVATDNNGAQSVSAVGVFKVIPTNTLPKVWISAPANVAAFPAGIDLTLAASVVPGSGVVTNVEFFVNDQRIGNDELYPYEILECCWKADTFRLQAKVMDNLGGSAISTNTIIVVGDARPMSVSGAWDNAFSDKFLFAYTEGLRAVSAATNGDVFLAGAGFGDVTDKAIFGDLRYSVVKWDGETWSGVFPAEGIPEGTPANIFISQSLLPVSDSLYIAGNAYYGGAVSNYTRAGYVVRVDGTGETSIGEKLPILDFDTVSSHRLGVTSMALKGSELFIGGDFTRAESNPNVQYVARLAGTNWVPVGNGLTMVSNGAVRAIANFAGTLYIGGDFVAAGGNTNIRYLAKLEGTTWTSVGAGVDGPVRALAVCNNDLYVGGDFNSAGAASSVGCIAKWNGNEWSALGHGVAGGTDSEDFLAPWSIPSIHTISVRGNEIFVGGEFSTSYNGNTPVTALQVAKATWDERSHDWTWSALDLGVFWPKDWNGNTTDYVLGSSIYQQPGTNSYDVYFAGSFARAGLTKSRKVARWQVQSAMATNVPSVSISSPQNFTGFDENTIPITLTATAIASGANTINNDSVYFYRDGTLLGNGIYQSGDSYAFTWNDPPLGLSRLKAVATDSAYQMGESLEISIVNKSTTNTLVAATDSFTIIQGAVMTNLNVLANDLPTGNGLRIADAYQTQGALYAQVRPSFDGGSVSYSPNPNLYGKDVFEYVATNSVGGVDTGAVTVKIRARPGSILSAPNDSSRFKTNTTVVLTGAAWDMDGVATNVQIYVNDIPYGSGLVPTAAGSIGYQTKTNGLALSVFTKPSDNFSTNWITDQIGFYTFKAVTTCNHGINTTSAPITIVVTNTVAGNAPVADILNLSESTNSQSLLVNTVHPIIRDGLFQLQGTANGTSPVAYQVLLYRPQDWETAVESLSQWIAFGGEPFANITPPGTNNAQGFRMGSVVAGNLGDLDLTGIPNGTYDLVLRVRGGTEEACDIVRVQIESNLKIGQFSFSEQDLVLPVNGIPLTVTRTYNSLNPLSSDFGHSWTYALNSMDVEIDEDRAIVTALDTLDGDGDLPPLNPLDFSLRVGGGRNVTLTLPDGRRATFQFSYAKTTSAEDCPSCYDGEWIAPPGVTATLTTLNPATKHSTGDNTVVALFSPMQPYWQAGGALTPLEAYDIPTLVLTTEDGTKYFITRDAENQEKPTYIFQDVTGLLGNSYKTYYIKPHPGKPKLTKILQRSGDYIKFTDTSVTHYNTNDVATRSIFMQRDAAGRIKAIFDPNSGVTDEASAANAKALVKYIYNRDNGNLIQVQRLQDRTVGNYLTTKYHYDHPQFPHYITSIEDPRGIPLARNEYDDSGRLTAVVDADGKRTEFDHNTTGRFERVIDRLGNTNTFVYDTTGNVIFVTNSVNVVTATGYGDSRFPTAETAVTNALGLTSQQTWTLYTYDQYGYKTNVVTSPDHTNSFRYDAFGNLLWQRDPVGNVTTNGYDGFGNLTNTVQLDASGIPIGGSSTVYENGLLKETRDFNGNLTASFKYDPSGNLTNTTDANNVSRRFRYDANGNQTESTYTWTDGISSQIVTNTTIYDPQGRVMASVDALGNTNRTFYNALGKVDYTVDKLGNTNSFLYDPRGNLIRTIDALGLTNYTVYDDAGRAYFTLDRNGVTGTHTYFDAAGRATNVVRVTNAVVTIQAGPISVLTSGGTPISTNATEYFPSGWVKKRVGPDNQPTTYAYWPDGQTMYVTNALNQTTFYKYDSAGRQEYVADALNRTNRFEYDAAGRMFKTVFHNGTYTSNYFNNLGQRTVVRDQGGMLTQFGYDHTGQLTNVIKPQVIDGVTGNPTTNQWTYKYDAYGRQTESIDPKVHSTTNSYDAFGREVSRWLPMGGAGTTNHYNTLGQLTNQVDFKGQRKQIRYDHFGRVGTNFYFTSLTATHPSNTVVYLYNHLGQLTNITERIGADASSGYVAALGMPGGKTGRYAALLAFVNRIPPSVQGGTLGVLLCGLVAMAFFTAAARSRRVRTWEFTRTLLTTIRAYTFPLSTGREGRGEVVRSPLQFRSLPSSILKLPPSLIALCSYAAFVLRCGGTPDGTPRRFRLPSFGWRLVSVVTLAALIGSDPHFDGLWTARAACTDPGNSNSSPTIRITEFSYDVEGRLAQVISPEGYLNYTYDLATGRHMGTCTKNSETTYEYDTLGRLWKVHAIKRNGSTINETTTYTYTAVGSRESVSLPNGVVTTWQYDELNRLTNVANVKTSGSVLLSQFSYKLDLSGRRTNALEIIKQEDSTSPGYQTNAMTWQYDGLYRLTNEVCVAMVPSASYTNRFQYDKTGNRWSNVRIVNSGTTTVTNQYNNNDQLLKEVTLSGTTPIVTNTYVYDANGSLIAKTNAPTTGNGSTNLYSYDLKNKMSQVASYGSSGSWGTNNFLYNERGIRVRTTPNSGSPTLYLVDGNNHTGYAQVLEELSALDGSASKSYLLGDDVLGQGSGSSAGSYLLYDGHGSTRQLVNSSGTVTSRYNYDAYGQTLSGTSSSTAETSLLYCGEQYDSNLQMYNLRARFYDPSNGRFNAMDTFKGNHFDPQSLHKYAYAHCDPVNGIDPSGEFSLTELLFVATIVGLLAAQVAGTITYYRGGTSSQIFEAQIKWFLIGFSVGALAYGVTWLVSAAFASATVATSVGTVSVGLRDKWTSLPNLVQHFRDHASQIAKILSDKAYTLEKYAADAVWTVENGMPAINRYGQTVYVHFMGNDPNSMKAKFAYVVVNESGKIITYWSMGVKELQEYVPKLFGG